MHHPHKRQRWRTGLYGISQRFNQGGRRRSVGSDIAVNGFSSLEVLGNGLAQLIRENDLWCFDHGFVLYFNNLFVIFPGLTTGTLHPRLWAPASQWLTCLRSAAARTHSAFDPQVLMGSRQNERQGQIHIFCTMIIRNGVLWVNKNMAGPFFH